MTSTPYSPDNPDAPNIMPDADPYQEPERTTVEVDTLIKRDDLGPGASTLIAAGDEIPEQLEKLPRQARRVPATTSGARRTKGNSTT